MISIARRVGCAALLGVALLVARERTALASPGYADALKQDLTLSYTPTCSLCHSESDASMPPSDTPFGRSMVAHGLLGDDDLASLTQAIAAMRKDDTDSDGDGATDLDELSWGGDPNTPDLPTASPEQSAGPKYGCGVGVDGGRWSGPFECGLLLLIMAGRRRRSSPQ
jgi:hypothetical protein